MFLLPSRLRDIFGKRRPWSLRGVLFKNEGLVRTVRELAVSQRRGEQDIYDDIVETGMNALKDSRHYEQVWGLLSDREQQVTALTCLGFKSYEMAMILGVSYETIRSHSKHIYAKFRLGRKELRRALQHWNFDAWWEDHHG